MEKTLSEQSSIDGSVSQFDLEEYRRNHFSPNGPLDQHWVIYRHNFLNPYFYSNPTVRDMRLDDSFVLTETSFPKINDSSWIGGKESATTLRMHGTKIYIGFDSGKIRTFNTFSKEYLVAEKFEGPILDINPTVEKMWTFVIGGQNLFGIHKGIGYPISSPFKDFVEILVGTRYGALIVSKNGYLSRIRVCDTRAVVMPITQLVQNIEACTWVLDDDAEEEDGLEENGINLVVYSKNMMAIFHVYEPERDKGIKAEHITTLDFGRHSIKHCALFDEQFIFFTGQPADKPLLNVLEFKTKGINYRPYLSYELLEYPLPIGSIKQFSRNSNRIILTAALNIIMVYLNEVKNSEPEFLIQLENEPEKVAFHRGFIIIIYRQNKLEIKKLKGNEWTASSVCQDCLPFFENVLNYRITSSSWAYCKCFFK